MLSELQVIEKINEKTGLNVRPATLEKFSRAGLIDKPVLLGVSGDKTFYNDNTPNKFIRAIKKNAVRLSSTLVNRRFERDGDTIKMYSTYDHSDILRQNYLDRMSGERYIDNGQDFMKAGRIPLEYLASLSPEERHELETNPKALVKLFEEHPLWRTSTANL